MKTASYIFCGALLMGLGVGSVSAEPITVKLTGHVRQWSDMAGSLGGQVAAGQTVTATYTYDTVTPDLDSSASFGHYRPSVAQGASVRIATGSLIFESHSMSQFEAFVVPGSPQGGGGVDAVEFPKQSVGRWNFGGSDHIRLL